MSGRAPLDPRCRLTLTGAALLLMITLCPSTASSAPGRHGHLRLDPNRATRAELELLPRIGPTLAAYVVEHRTHRGPFRQLADLDDVPRIGPATLAGLRPWLTFPTEAPDSEPR